MKNLIAIETEDGLELRDDNGNGATLVTITGGTPEGIEYIRAVLNGHAAKVDALEVIQGCLSDASPDVSLALYKARVALNSCQA